MNIIFLEIFLKKVMKTWKAFFTKYSNVIFQDRSNFKLDQSKLHFADDISSVG